jgi:hypothetical protein
MPDGTKRAILSAHARTIEVFFWYLAKRKFDMTDFEHYLACAIKADGSAARITPSARHIVTMLIGDGVSVNAR